MMKIPFGGRILILGCGAVSRCFQPLVLRHIDMDFTKLTVMDFEDLRAASADVIAAGGRFVQDYITPHNYAQTLSQHLGPGDILIDLAWNIETLSLMRWCHDNNVGYINTSVELWDPYAGGDIQPPTERTLYVRHMALRKQAARWSEPWSTFIVEHGANPGLVSHWVKVGLEDIAKAILQRGTHREREDLLEQYLADADYPRLAMLTGVKVIHISERDTQISNKPKEVDEFVNTWSVEGFREEGVAPAEMGWGTHERRLPKGAQKHAYGPGNQICLSQMGINTWVRSWVPGGDIIGMVVRHGEAFTISDYLTVWDDDVPIYRPTVHYAYLPSDAAIASLHEFRMRNYRLQPKVRIMNDEIVSGKDELGVLLLGHDLNGWWVGSQLDIHEARRLVPHQNATTLQVAAAILGALFWLIKNPYKGLCVPDDLPHKEVLEIANPYLGPTPSMHTDWTPLKHWHDPFEHFGRPRPHDEDVWQFDTFLVQSL
ncbi:MAG: saccharopine dehydrogenase NADP-binding domain-containing protein [Anaerolineae bacterium]|nr:saccharopine dehydrogenase NADP-binding domain-containing protein [Candidatus Roseilinea sp.]MDW8451441.1 saccharopine dehydrogenase NADP-binding domain-containing protein [Anaerolineae bacterium]